MAEHSFEILESPDEGARFCFAHHDTQSTVGLIILKADGELPRHKWPTNTHLMQASGQCAVTLFDPDTELTNQHELGPGNDMTIAANLQHILTNIGDEESVILFKVTGDASEIVRTLRSTYSRINPTAA